MNFLRHPLYTALALGACSWLSFANARGLSFFQLTSPASWKPGGTAYIHGSGGHSHFSHK